jgi:hypothetical protein
VGRKGRGDVRRLIAVAALTLFLLPATANADPFTPELNYAYRLATNFWGGPPAGCSSVDLQVVPNGSIGDYEGEATMPEPGEPPKACFMDIIERDANPNWFIRACAVIRHEAGHLHGLDHSTNPRSIMYPTVLLIPKECWVAGLFVINHPRRFQRGN